MKKLRHAGIVVSDLERSLDFYQKMLGLTMHRRTDEAPGFIDKICGLKDVKLTTVKLAADDGNLVELLYFHSLNQPDKGRKLNDLGASHIAFTVEDVEKEYKRLISKGVKFVSQPQASPDGSVKVVFCKDPDDVFIELVEEMKR